MCRYQNHNCVNLILLCSAKCNAMLLSQISRHLDKWLRSLKIFYCIFRYMEKWANWHGGYLTALQSGCHHIYLFVIYLEHACLIDRHP